MIGGILLDCLKNLCSFENNRAPDAHFHIAHCNDFYLLIKDDFVMSLSLDCHFIILQSSTTTSKSIPCISPHFYFPFNDLIYLLKKIIIIYIL